MFFTIHPDKYWFQTVLILGIAMLLVLWYKRHDLSRYYEGFQQDAPYVLKQGCDAYDPFYVEIYDQLMLPDKRCMFETDKIIEMTQPTQQNSVFLDIGVGTGHLAKQLLDRGFRVYGVDKSEAMVEHAEEKCPNAVLKCGDATEPMLYDAGTFTHITCLGMTIYQFGDKIDFFQNCYFWLKPGGYLIVHFVDPARFDPIIPGGKPPLLDNPQQYASSRITDTIIDFIDFKYKAQYDFSDLQTKKHVQFKETFTDELTKNVRQNETTLYMENMDTLLKVAARCGFIVHGQVTLSQCTGDNNQFLVIFERPQ
jgi:SAM-dependent methyltransferase